LRTYICSECAYELNEKEGDPYNGVAPYTLWEELDDDFRCPMCGAEKDRFEVAENR
jgi:rubredoxin